MIIVLLGKGDTNIERENLNEPHGDGLELEVLVWTHGYQDRVNVNMDMCLCYLDSVVYISNFNPKLQYTWNRDTLTAMSTLSTQILAFKYQFH